MRRRRQAATNTPKPMRQSRERRRACYALVLERICAPISCGFAGGSSNRILVSARLLLFYRPRRETTDAPN